MRQVHYSTVRWLVQLHCQVADTLVLSGTLVHYNHVASWYIGTVVAGTLVLSGGWYTSTLRWLGAVYCQVAGTADVV